MALTEERIKALVLATMEAYIPPKLVDIERKAKSEDRYLQTQIDMIASQVGRLAGSAYTNKTMEIARLRDAEQQASLAADQARRDLAVMTDYAEKMRAERDLARKAKDKAVATALMDLADRYRTRATMWLQPRIGESTDYARGRGKGYLAAAKLADNLALSKEGE